jgi:hypothetical protein
MSEFARPIPRGLKLLGASGKCRTPARPELDGRIRISRPIVEQRVPAGVHRDELMRDNTRS